MYFAIKKNRESGWDVIPTSGQLQGQAVATVEGVDMTSVSLNAEKAVGQIKAVWGLVFKEGVDVFSDMETIRALALGKAFKGEADRAVRWGHEGAYDLDTGHILKQCKRLVILGSSIFRRN